MLIIFGAHLLTIPALEAVLTLLFDSHVFSNTQKYILLSFNIINLIGIIVINVLFWTFMNTFNPFWEFFFAMGDNNYFAVKFLYKMILPIYFVFDSSQVYEGIFLFSQIVVLTGYIFLFRILFIIFT